MNATLTYQEVLNLGFIRTNVNDDVFFNIYGWSYFVMALTSGEITLEWDNHTHEISLYKNSNLISNAITQDELEFTLKLIK